MDRENGVNGPAIQIKMGFSQSISIKRGENKGPLAVRDEED